MDGALPVPSIFHDQGGSGGSRLMAVWLVGTATHAGSGWRFPLDGRLAEICIASMAGHGSAFVVQVDCRVCNPILGSFV